MTNKFPETLTLILFQTLFLLVTGFSTNSYGQEKNSTIKSDEVFKDWNFAPRKVYGIGKLRNTTNRTYYKISEINDSLTLAEEFNPAGILTNRTKIHFKNGMVSRIIEANRWGEEYSTFDFTPCGDGEFFVEKKTYGENAYLPCKKIKYKYKNDLLIEMMYYSDSGNACTCANGAALIRYNRLSDNNRFSFIEQVDFFDINERPALQKNHDFHKEIFDYDENGNKLSEAYFGLNNEPVLDRFGVFTVKREYDSNDNKVQAELFGLDLQLANNVYGVAKTAFEFKNGFQVSETSFDNMNNITASSETGDGIAITKHKYDSASNEIEETYYDIKDQPANNHEGIQRISYSYSQDGMITSVSYFDALHQPVSDDQGVHKYVYGRDSVGKIVEKSFFNTQDYPCRDNFDRVNIIKYRYDNYGRKLSVSYWSDEHERMTRWNGYHAQLISYNNDGRPTEYTYLDTEDNFTTSENGYSRQIITYNTNGLISERSFFDGDTAVLLKIKGYVKNYHAIKYYFDTTNRITSLEYFDTNQYPVNAIIKLNDSTYNCHRIEFIYSGERITTEKFYNINNDVPSAVIDCIRSRYISTVGNSTRPKNK